MVGVDLKLLLSIQTERIVQRDNTVRFGGLCQELPGSKDRVHFMRCPVLVHEFLDGMLRVSPEGQLPTRFGIDGHLATPPRRKAA